MKQWIHVRKNIVEMNRQILEHILMSVYDNIMVYCKRVHSERINLPPLK